ncbi:hypothetical protein GGR54DRAFT_637722 [Hypoxylon sp. NC1633]|nr:hypothetical protein GGR54DRAFT_637722 [Hypoxylon sp. NC1633]
MDTATCDVVVDSAPAVVTQFRFAPLAYYLHTPSTSQKDWHVICGLPLTAIWLYAPPSADSQPNDWKIGLELSRGDIMTLELYDTETSAGSVLLIRPLITDAPAETRIGYSKLTEIRAACIGRPIKGEVALFDIITKLKATNLLKYQLENGRGRRHWILAVLTEIHDFMRTPKAVNSLAKESDELMRSCWVAGGLRLKGYGFEDEPANPLTIAPGSLQVPQIFIEK